VLYIYIYIYIYAYIYKYVSASAQSTRVSGVRLVYAGSERTGSYLVFSRYCHYQYCIACIAIQGGRGWTLDCAIVLAMKGGNGVPKQGGVFANNSIESCTKALN